MLHHKQHASSKCLSTIVPQGTRLQDAAWERYEMAQDCPVCTQRRYPAYPRRYWSAAGVRPIFKIGRDLDAFPSRPLHYVALVPLVSHICRLLHPAAQQPPNFSDYAADVFVLS